MQFPGKATGWHKYTLPDNVQCTTRMHLNQKQVATLIPLLQRFVETGGVGSMMNKTERAEFEQLRNENDRLRRKLERLEKANEKQQGTVVDLELAIDDFSLAMERQLKEFKNRAVEILTGTPAEDQAHA